MENVEISGQKVGGDSQIKLTVNTLIKIVGGLFFVINLIAGWAYFDLRGQLKEATEISQTEKSNFLREIEDEYDGKLDEMLREMLEMKGDIKVILDRENRLNPVQPSPNASFQPVQPPPSN